MPASSALAARLKTAATLMKGRVPRQVIIQLTDACNASCAQCSMRASSPLKRSRMEPDTARALIDALAERGTLALSFTGGEPFLFAEEVTALAAHARDAGIECVRTGTNGFFLRGSEKPDFEGRVSRLAEGLARAGLRNFWISLDSADPAVHEANRGLPGLVRGIEKALPIFHAHGVYPAANLGLNRLTGGNPPISGRTGTGELDPLAFRYECLAALRKFFGFVEGLGFTTANACYPMSHDPDGEMDGAPGKGFGNRDEGWSVELGAGRNGGPTNGTGKAPGQAVYAATSSAAMIRFSPAEKVLLFEALSQVVGEFRSRLRLFTPRSALLSLARQYAGRTGTGAACRGGRDFFFISARDGQAYPCGYRGAEPLGSFLAPGPLREPDGDCRRCDWECFRDPSILAGPLLGLATRPVRAARDLMGDPEFARAWWGDLRYARACGLFDGRRPPDREKLAAFAPRT